MVLFIDIVLLIYTRISNEQIPIIPKSYLVVSDFGVKWTLFFSDQFTFP